MPSSHPPPHPHHAPKIRILSLDGGGIYGLTQALWLEQICHDDATFLDTSVGTAACPRYVFSGTSSGAVNALLLAAQDNPRALVTSGKLVQFWKEPGLYLNKNPFDWAMSFFGLTPWLGTQDALQVLRAYLQDRKLGDIPKKHWVVISTYNWHGSRPEFPQATAAPTFPWWMPPWMTGGWTSPGASTNPGPSSQPATSWHPRMFTNFAIDPHGQTDDDYFLYDVAYGAIAMPSARAVRGGVGDGAIFNANPAVDTITAILYHKKLEACGKGKKTPVVTDTDYAAELVPDTLSRLHMLSMGDGAAQPNYWLRDFNFGALPFIALPSNPLPGAFHSRFGPQGYSLNQPIQDAAIQARALLDNRYHRMNPGVMPIPPGPLVYPVRSNVIRPFIIQAIEQSVQTPISVSARQASLDYLKNGWMDTVPPDPVL